MKQRFTPLEVIFLSFKNCLITLDKIRVGRQIIDSKTSSYQSKYFVYNDILMEISSKDSNLNEFCNETVKFISYYSSKELGALLILKQFFLNRQKEIPKASTFLHKIRPREDLVLMERNCELIIEHLNQELCVLAENPKNFKNLLEIEMFKNFVNKDNFQLIFTKTACYVEEFIASQIYNFWYFLNYDIEQLEECVRLGVDYPYAREHNLRNNGIKYKNWDDKNKGTIALEKAFFDLIKNGMICSSTKYSKFSNFFRGNRISTPIIWTGLKSDLSYFFKLLHSHFEIIEVNRKYVYKIVCNTFIDPNGKKFKFEKFKSDKPTSNAAFLHTVATNLATKEQIDSANIKYNKN